ncbi:type I restriction enzyme, R subunit [Mucilaginibacter lappiensis]|uniref:Type I restriction enzyme endonuclease subunit n=1 Tax=Mucilaginibacter lappiensis TaxID=354630 RepID=A0ABR6PSM7_9SPHI|nr:type I restriction endonuclease subunit R [Mucilaginibacter lappiensis]MBB6111271.1 type I restriction enzyme R subunit [Mucilaginibacter lappiensis]SIR74322.1 type I restriction enzyme, R subunit [Mucilaginibacter lappiensis]
MNSISENEIEEIALGYLQTLGYQYLNGLVMSPDGEHPERQYSDVVLVTRLRDAIDKLNPDLKQEAKEDALKKVLRTESPNPLINNETFHRYLTEGVDVEMRTSDGIRGEKVYLVDFNQPERNEFLAVNQFTIIEGNQNKRPDIILFINGLPLVVIELKNAVDENATIKTAYNQIQTYKWAIPSLFTYNELVIVSDGWDALCGTITSDYGRFMSWKTKDGNTTADTLQPQMEVMFTGMLNKTVLLDLIYHFIVFEKSKDKTLKKVAAYHQYYAVNKAVRSTVKASGFDGDKRGGVIWHTQGSGKSLSMVFYSGKLIVEPEMENPTLVILTDRNDLDDQLFETFSNCQQLLRQEPQQAENRRHLRTLLKVASGGIVFTTIQKFMPGEVEVVQPNMLSEPAVEYIGADIKALSDRKNIVVIADEAHRSQYDFIDGFAKHLRDALPNASFIGFTGTPVESTDRNTQAVFGNYVDIYDIQQAVNDHATVPIFYESRLAKVHFEEDEKVKLDEQFEELTEGEELSNRQQLRARWTRLESIVGNPNRIKKIAEDLVNHFEQRNAVLDGKAMIVCMSRRICVEMYQEIIRIRPNWHSDDDNKGTIKVVMTGSSTDALNMQPHIRNKTRRKAIGERLKNPADSLKLVIVRDMWLTGFDAPCLHTLYVDKPMRGHSLMQAIARVNRVFTEGKAGGLVVDYLGIAQELKHALAEYTASGGEGKPTLDQELAVAKMLEIYEAIEYQLRHFDWKKFFSLKPEEKLKFIPVIVDYIFSQENGEQSFVENTNNLLKAFAISVPHDKAIAIRDNVALFQAIKARLVKISDRNEGGKSDEEIDTAIKQIISEAITADKVIDIFDAAGLKKPSIEILDERFLQELKDLPQKNLAVELLKRLLKDEIKKRTKINLVESKKFSEMLEDAIKRYHNGMIDTVEFLEKVLIPFAEQIKAADKRGEKLGLDYREYAFYTALEINNSAVSLLGDETLKHIAQELLKTVRNSTTIDWTIKESVQSALRRNIRRILRLHGYPPDLQEKAVETIITQAKMLADDLDNNRID